MRTLRIYLSVCFRNIEKIEQGHLANKHGNWILNPGFSDFKIHGYSTTVFLPSNLVGIWCVHCNFSLEDVWLYSTSLIEDTMFLTQTQVCGLKADSQIGAMLFKVSRDWFWPDGSCHGLLGQIYTRDHKLNDSENKGKGLTKQKPRVKTLK